MEDDEAAEVRPAPRPVQIPTLRDVCVNTLIRYRQYLGDVGFMDSESLRAVAWHCSTEQLARIEDETLEGSDRNLEWYTWHLWKRLLETELGGRGAEVPPLESPEPPDYTAPRGIEAQPGDYRLLYSQRKAEMEERAAAARERIAAAYQQAQEQKDARKAKMIDKLAPTKRHRTGASASSSAAGRLPGQSAYLHKPRPDSRSSIMGKPGAQLKLLKDLGLVKPGGGGGSGTTSTVRIVRPASAVPSAATGHSSSLAGAQLLARATAGQLGRTHVGASGRLGLHQEAQPPLLAARSAAVAAAAAARSGVGVVGGGGAGGSIGSRGAVMPGLSPGGSKRPAGEVSLTSQPPGKQSRTA
ncbi:hypothetical protein Agub_g13329, partial [Astrephomene gubernaculifera]